MNDYGLGQRAEWQDEPANDDVRFSLTAFDDIKPSHECNYLVKGIIPRQGLTLVYGQPKCGKSFWTFDLVMHIALGREYRGHRVEQGAVCYLSCEGFSGFPNRVEAFRRECLGEHDGCVPFWLLPTRIDLIADHQDLIADIARTLSGHRIEAIVIDTLNRSMVGSESKDEDMAAYLKAAEAIRDMFDCAVIIVHHTGVDATRPRGHTSLTGAVDAQLAVKRNGNESVVVSVEFMKDGEEGATLTSKLSSVVVGADERGDTITSCVITPVDIQSAETNRPKLSPVVQRAYDQLCTAIMDAGQTAPASNHIPSTKRVCPVGVWRECCLKAQISSGTNRDSPKRSFNRASRKLQDLGFIEVWGDFVWLRDKRDKAGQ